MTEQIKIKEEEINVNSSAVTQSETVVEPMSQAKSIIDNTLVSILQFIGKPWHKVLSALTLCNKFTVIVLLAFFASGYLPAIKLFGSSQSLYEMTDVSLFKMMILMVAVLYALGVKRMISKIASIVLVLVVFYQLNEMLEMFSGFTGGNRSAINADSLQMVAKATRYGLVVWLLSFITLIILSLLPLYQTNKKLWPSIVETIKTKSESNVDVQKVTSSVGASFQSAVKKGQASIEKINSTSGSEKMNEMKTLTTNKKLAVVSAVIVVVIIIPMMFSGNSAPSNADVEAIFSEGTEVGNGLFEGEFSNIDVSNCEELSNNELPTFRCDVSGVVTVDLGAFGSLLGGKSKNSEKFNETLILIEGENGWYAE